MSNYVYEKKNFNFTVIYADVYDEYGYKISISNKLLGIVKVGEEYFYDVEQLRKSGRFGLPFTSGFVCDPKSITGTATKNEILYMKIVIYCDSNNNGIPDIEEPSTN